jgi:hypothetical protein
MVPGVYGTSFRITALAYKLDILSKWDIRGTPELSFLLVNLSDYLVSADLRADIN